MDYEKKYKEVLERARQVHATNVDENKKSTEYIFPELKESEDERVRKEILLYFTSQDIAHQYVNDKRRNRWTAWLKKQGDTNETINMDEFAQGVLRGAAINLITWIDYNTAKGNMCLSNMECKVIEDALVNGDWDKIYAYIKRKLEKQGESKFESCIQEGDKIVTNDDGTHFNVSQLERTAKKVTESKEAVKEFLKKAGIIDGNGELADEYRPEKQGEKKSINDTDEEIVEAVKDTSVLDLVEPKFKVGDWIIDIQDGEILHINKVRDYAYYLTNLEGASFDTPRCSIETWNRLWTIQDAKDGDILKEDSCTFIIERMKPDGTAIIHCCLFDDGDFDLGSTLSFDVDSTKPASKEQRDLLFQKMKEAGYEWDAEKKELNLLITNGGDFFLNRKFVNRSLLGVKTMSMFIMKFLKESLIKSCMNMI